MEMETEMDKWWKYIYDLWLEEGDLKVLEYLQKIQRYLEKRRHTQQEILNLTTQIEALLNIVYRGSYTYRARARALTSVQDILLTMQPYPPLRPNDLPCASDLEELTEFFENRKGIKIVPQTTEHMFQHPCWILWTALYSEDDRHALWSYRKQFIYCMDCKDYRGAARVYQHAINIKERNDPLPLYSPEVIQFVMYSNVDYFAQEEGAS